MRRCSLLMLVGLALATSGAAGSGRWVRLGQSDLDPRGDRVEIRLRGNQRIEALCFGVDNASVRILAARVQFGNGRVVDWPIRGAMYPRQRTQAFDLPGFREQRVRRVMIFYETGHRGRQVHPDQDRPWDRDWAVRDENRGRERGPAMARGEERPMPPRDMDRDREAERDSRWDPNWDPNWERDYGQLKPNIVVWGRE